MIETARARRPQYVASSTIRRVTTTAELNNSVHEKEHFNMKYALARFRVYLLGDIPFVAIHNMRHYARL